MKASWPTSRETVASFTPRNPQKNETENPVENWKKMDDFPKE